LDAVEVRVKEQSLGPSVASVACGGVRVTTLHGVLSGSVIVRSVFCLCSLTIIRQISNLSVCDDSGVKPRVVASAEGVTEFEIKTAAAENGLLPARSNSGTSVSLCLRSIHSLVKKLCAPLKYESMRVQWPRGGVLGVRFGRGLVP
jgi:hypothetical protein